jgi:hypothetical protein
LGVLRKDGNENYFIDNDAVLTGANNFVLSHDAFSSGDGNFNIAIGSNCLAAASNSINSNIAIGNLSMGSGVSGSENVCVGASAGFGISSGDRNTFIGDGAGGSFTGSNNVCIGYSADVSNSTVNSIVIGSQAASTLSNQCILGNSNVNEVSNSADISCDLGHPSRRWKDAYIGGDMILGNVRMRATSTPSDGQILTYSTSTNRAEFQTKQAFSDVMVAFGGNVSSNGNNRYLRYNGSGNQADESGVNEKTDFVCPIDGTITKMSWRTQNAVNAQFAVVINGFTTGTTFTTANITGGVATVSRAIVAGNIISIRKSNSAIPGRCTVTIYITNNVALGSQALAPEIQALQSQINDLQSSQNDLNTAFAVDTSVSPTVISVNGSMVVSEIVELNPLSIESPLNNYYYPLFNSITEAEQWSNTNGGNGSYETKIFANDPTSGTYYLPNGSESGSSGTNVAPPSEYQTITTDNSSLIPNEPQKTFADINENVALNNVQILPLGSSTTAVVQNQSPSSWLTVNGNLLEGTAPSVAADTTFTFELVFSNEWGSQAPMSCTMNVLDAPFANGVADSSMSFSKMVQFDGSNDYLRMNNSSNNNSPLRKTLGSSQSTNVGTLTSSYGQPWMLSCIFRTNTNNLQTICSQGSTGTADSFNLNIQNGALISLWGSLLSTQNRNVQASNVYTTNTWTGICLIYDGYDLFRMYTVDLNNGNVAYKVAFQYGGAYTGSAIQGSMAIGQNNNNANRFSGDIASFALTTLKCGVALPTNEQIQKFVLDPMDYVNTEMVGNTYRVPNNTSNTSNFQISNSTSQQAVHIYQMGSNGSGYPIIIDSIGNTTAVRMDMLNMTSGDITNITGFP